MNPPPKKTSRTLCFVIEGGDLNGFRAKVTNAAPFGFMAVILPFKDGSDKLIHYQMPQNPTAKINKVSLPHDEGLWTNGGQPYESALCAIRALESRVALYNGWPIFKYTE